ncbi:MAG: glycosyltransferase family 2 protein [Chitinophagales bacterium]|nr:glycosyltransferase family 2 protein [Chitinophagales bacterium]
MLSVVILTYNEELNIRQVLDNIVGWADEIIVVDSYSTDKTLEIIKDFPVNLYQRKFDNYANQRNFAIKEIPKANEWMLFLDADEYLTEELKTEILEELINSKYNGYFLKRRFYFMGKWIKYGGYYPTKLLRLFKWRVASCERDINEHIHVDGETGVLKYDFADKNNKNFHDWIDKHNRYSDFESTQFKKEKDPNAIFFGNNTQRKLWIRDRIWNRLMPPLIRPFIYFFYRYFIRLGFLDGKIGFIYHFMHGLVFYFIIDVKYLEKSQKLNKN